MNKFNRLFLYLLFCVSFSVLAVPSYGDAAGKNPQTYTIQKGMFYDNKFKFVINDVVNKNRIYTVTYQIWLEEDLKTITDNQWSDGDEIIVEESEYDVYIATNLSKNNSTVFALTWWEIGENQQAGKIHKGRFDNKKILGTFRQVYKFAFDDITDCEIGWFDQDLQTVVDNEWSDGDDIIVERAGVMWGKSTYIITNLSKNNSTVIAFVPFRGGGSILFG